MAGNFFQYLDKINFLFHFLAILSAVALYFIIKPYNVGFSPDSMTYLEVAENIVKGNGIVNNKGDIVDHWPPLFPIALALVSKLSGATLVKTGVVLMPLLLYFTILIYLFILKQLKLNLFLILFSGLLLAVSQFTKNYLWYLSEGIFLVFLLLSFFFMLKWLNKKEQKYLILTGVCCGFFFLSRYAGVGFMGAYIFFIIIQNRNCFRRIWKNLLLLILPIIITVTPWFLYIQSFAENPEGRQMAIHVVPLSKLFDLVKTFGFWFMGSELAVGSFLLLIIIYFTFLYRRKYHIFKIVKQFYRGNLQYLQLCLLLICTYIAFLLVSISFYDAWTPLDNRILSPVFPFFLSIAAVFLQKLQENKIVFLFWGTCCCMILSLFSSTFSSFQVHYTRGSGYTKAQWTQSKTLLKWKENKKKVPIYTNGVEIGILHLGIDPLLLPLKNKETEINDLFKKVEKGEAEIVFFKEVNWRNYLVGQEKILENIECKDVKGIFLEDGVIIRANE